MGIKYCDVFSGLGGFSLAIRAVDPEAECVFASEIDKNARAVFHANFGIEPYGDITKIDPANIPEHDVLFGGFPCQPFSRNGRHYNFNNRTVIGDSRANLFLNLIAILHVKQPKYFVFENVKGLTKMKNEDGSLYMNTILDHIRAAGYNCQHKVLDAADYGVPQQRARIFFVGTRADLSDTFEFPKPEPRSASLFNILEHEVHDKYFLHNLWKKRTVKKTNSNLPAGTLRLDVLKAIYDNNQNKPTQRTSSIESVAIIYGETPSGLPRQQDKIYSPFGISPTIATFSTPCIAIQDDSATWRQLTPRECTRLQGIPDSFKLAESDAVAYKQIGNAINVTVVSKLLLNLLGQKLP